MPIALVIRYPADDFPDGDDEIISAVGSAPEEATIQIGTDSRELFFQVASLAEVERVRSVLTVKSPRAIVSLEVLKGKHS